MSKTSDLLLSPKTTLPALLTAAGAPSYLASLLVPIRESGALLPQVLYAKLLEKHPNRHRAWRLGMFIQLACSLVMLLAGLYLQGLIAGLVIVAALLVLSLSRALCSLTNKDIQGVHVNEGERGKLIGSASSLSALLTILVSVFALFSNNFDLIGANSADTTIARNAQDDKFWLLGGLAILAQAACLLVMWRLKTKVDTASGSADSQASKSEGNSLSDNGASSKIGLSERLSGFVKSFNSSLPRFILMRSLFSHSALIAPLFILSYQGNLVSVVAYLVLTQAFASLLSSYVWGALSDKSALLCMQIGAALAIISSSCLAFLVFMFSETLTNIYWIVALYLLLSLGHAGVRTGRKIYSLDIADEHERTDFVAKSNSAVGTFILLAGLAYSALMALSTNLTLILMTLGLSMGLAISFFVKKEK